VIPAADPPPAVAAAPVDKPADVQVVSRDTRSDILASTDTPLPLIKAGRTEDALLRQAIVLTSTLAVVRPAVGEGGQALRWTYQPYLQRQLCFTSITGQFSCAAAESEALAETSAGEGPLPAATGQAGPASSPAAEAAREAVATALRARAEALFEDDRRLKLVPMLRAAGVRVRGAYRSIARLTRVSPLARASTERTGSPNMRR
jgi:hypothetical protein